jgi:hypothetical protein
VTRAAAPVMVNLPVMSVLLAPAPIKVMLLLMLSGDDHVALPTPTLIVAPLVALFTHVETLEKSGVLFQIGLDPVQAAVALEIPSVPKIINAKHDR